MTVNIDLTKESETPRKTTFVSFLLDETGSMQSIKDDTIGGFNEYVKTLQAAGTDILFSLVSFNSSRTERRYVAESIAEVKPLRASDYRPAAMTPLIDASVKIIRATADAVARRDDEPNVVIVIQTDGLENVSVEYDRRDLAALVKEKEAAGWEFLFLGAGLDAFDAAQRAGMALSEDRVLSYGRARSAQAFVGAARHVADFSELGDSAALDFSTATREAAGDLYHGRRKKESRKARRTRQARTAPTTRRPRDDEGPIVEDFEL